MTTVKENFKPGDDLSAPLPDVLVGYATDTIYVRIHKPSMNHIAKPGAVKAAYSGTTYKTSLADVASFTDSLNVYVPLDELSERDKKKRWDPLYKNMTPRQQSEMTLALSLADIRYDWKSYELGQNISHELPDMLIQHADKTILMLMTGDDDGVERLADKPGAVMAFRRTTGYGDPYRTRRATSAAYAAETGTKKLYVPLHSLNSTRLRKYFNKLMALPLDTKFFLRSLVQIARDRIKQRVSSTTSAHFSDAAVM